MWETNARPKILDDKVMSGHAQGDGHSSIKAGNVRIKTVCNKNQYIVTMGDDTVGETRL